ncbi:Pleiotropic regulatory protein [Candidatus Zixiibacteriota bacterium]|nr:Pleiotropic regulatory protein [candidate division Zixibacteria bacterium]
MKINFLDLRSQYISIKPEIDDAIGRVIGTSSFVLGPSVAKFEEDFARFCGCGEAIAVNSGTSALFLTLKALEIGPGDEVITAANTFIATAAAIIYTGATPILVDVDPETRNIDLNLVEKAVTAKTKVIIPVHLFGRMVDMERIDEIARKHSLAVLEDACQAHGATFKGKPAGSYGTAGAFSFYPGKNLGAYGEGGAVVTSEKELARKIRMLRDHGSEKKYFHDIIGYNARMEGIQGAVLGVKLKYLEKWNRERNRVATKYREILKGIPIVVPSETADYYQVYHLFVIETERRDALQQFLAESGVPTLIHYPIPIHKQQAYLKAGFKPGHFPVTERLADQILSLPIYPELPDDQIEYVASKIREFFGR